MPAPPRRRLAAWCAATLALAAGSLGAPHEGVSQHYVTTVVRQQSGGGSECVERDERAAGHLRTHQSPSFAVVVRFFNAELPYLEPFFRHYARLGVRMFYCLNNFPDQHALLVRFIRELRCLEATVMMRSSRSNASSYDLLKHNKVFFSEIEEDYVIMVDVDEFWLPPDGIADLPNLVAGDPAEVFYFPWAMVPNDSLESVRQPPYDGFVGHTGKWMAKTKNLAALLGPQSIHDPWLKSEGDCEAVNNNCGFVWNRWDLHYTGYLVHFWGRTFQDMALKVFGQVHMAKKTEGVQEAKALIAQGLLPQRLQLLAYFTHLRRYRAVRVGTDMQPPGLLVVNRTIEAGLLREYLMLGTDAETEAFLQQMHKVYDRYVAYFVNDLQYRDDFPLYGPCTWRSDVDIANWLANDHSTHYKNHVGRSRQSPDNGTDLVMTYDASVNYLTDPHVLAFYECQVQKVGGPAVVGTSACALVLLLVAGCVGARCWVSRKSWSSMGESETETESESETEADPKAE